MDKFKDYKYIIFGITIVIISFLIYGIFPNTHFFYRFTFIILSISILLLSLISQNIHKRLKISQLEKEQLKHDYEELISQKAKELEKVKSDLEIEIAESEKISGQLHAAHLSLKEKIKEIEEQNRKVNILNEILILLQGCVKLEEAFKVVSTYSREIFPLDSGAIYIFNNSRNLVEGVVMWGENFKGADYFMPEDCWAIRKGNIHIYQGVETDIICRHQEGFINIPYLCIPMIAQNEIMGILHFQLNPRETLTDINKKIMLTLSNNLSLTLSNLKLRETLKNQAIRDPLTGLFNRRYMEESLEREISRANRQQIPVGVMMIDIDHFKHYNDTYGHKVGDLILSELGKFFQRNIRKEDIACRYGGEEFVIIMAGASKDITLKRAEYIRQNVKNIEIIGEGTIVTNITLSIGVSIFPEHGTSVNEILYSADFALYKAKKEGRNKVVLIST